MRIIMASSIGGSIKENGKRIPAPLLGYNNFLEKIQNEWIHNSKVMIITASPNDYERNDMICECFTQSFPMSGLSISCMEICDNRNEKFLLPNDNIDILVSLHNTSLIGWCY